MARILIIDDDDALRDVMRRAMERAGHEAEGAEDGGVGVALVRSRPFDLVITDLLMPGQEGIETILALREEFPGVKILAISGGLSLGATDILEDAEILGADASLAKPFTVEELAAAVARLLPGG